MEKKFNASSIKSKKNKNLFNLNFLNLDMGFKEF